MSCRKAEVAQKDTAEGLTRTGRKAMAYLGNPKNTIEILQKYQFHFQKRYGQNFLIDGNVLERIIAAAEITGEDCVLEIGPGIGTMTQYLAEAAREVAAVEIDRNLIPILEDTLSDYQDSPGPPPDPQAPPSPPAPALPSPHDSPS